MSIPTNIVPFKTPQVEMITVHIEPVEYSINADYTNTELDGYTSIINTMKDAGMYPGLTECLNPTTVTLTTFKAEINTL